MVQIECSLSLQATHHFTYIHVYSLRILEMTTLLRPQWPCKLSILGHEQLVELHSWPFDWIKVVDGIAYMQLVDTASLHIACRDASVFGQKPSDCQWCQRSDLQLVMTLCHSSISTWANYQPTTSQRKFKLQAKNECSCRARQLSHGDWYIFKQ